MPSRLAQISTPWERERGLVFVENYESQALVEANGGEIVGSVAFPGNGVDLPGTAGNYVKHVFPASLFALKDGGDYVTILVEFYPDIDYTADVTAFFFRTNISGSIFADKRDNSKTNRIDIGVGGAVIDSVASAEYGSLWSTGGRNQLVISSADGDTSIWFNGSIMTDSDATAYSSVSEPEELYTGIDNDGSTGPFPGIISFIKVFKGDKFTTEEVSRLWSLDRRDPRARAECHWPLNTSRNASTTVQDATRHGRDLTKGDGVTASTYPTKLAGRHGYSFDGGDYFTGPTEPAVAASESLTIECEFELDNVAGFHGVVSRASGSSAVNYYLRVDDGKVEFYFRNAADTNNRQWESTNTVIEFTKRHHLIFQHTFGDSTSTRCFLDGVEVAGSWASGGSDQPLESASYTVQVGDREPAGQPLTGKIYQTTIWKEYLSRLEALELWTTARDAMGRRDW